MLGMILGLESVPVIRGVIDKVFETLGRPAGTKLLVASCGLPLVHGNQSLLTVLKEIFTHNDWLNVLMQILVDLQKHHVRYGTWKDLFGKSKNNTKNKIIHQLTDLAKIEFKKRTPFWEKCQSVLEESVHKTMDEDDEWIQINGEYPWKRSPETIRQYTHGFLNRVRKTFFAS